MSKYLPLAGGKMSPSVWREWIEIADLRSPFFRHGSPSVWREWIEMTNPPAQLPLQASPSVWREWIEIMS